MRPFTPGYAALAQPVEHIIRNDGVRCSSHLSGTISPFATVRETLKKPSKSDTLDAGSVASVRQLSLPFGEIWGPFWGPFETLKTKGPQMPLNDTMIRSLKPSHEELGSMANLARNTVGDTLRRLSDRGLVELGYRTTKVRDGGTLRAMVDDNLPGMWRHRAFAKP